MLLALAGEDPFPVESQDNAERSSAIAVGAFDGMVQQIISDRPALGLQAMKISLAHPRRMRERATTAAALNSISKSDAPGVLAAPGMVATVLQCIVSKVQSPEDDLWHRLGNLHLTQALEALADADWIRSLRCSPHRRD